MYSPSLSKLGSLDRPRPGSNVSTYIVHGFSFSAISCICNECIIRKNVYKIGGLFLNICATCINVFVTNGKKSKCEIPCLFCDILNFMTQILKSLKVWSQPHAVKIHSVIFTYISRLAVL